MIGGTPNVLVVNSALPVKTLEEFVDYAEEESRPAQLRLGRPGLLTHLTMELFKQEIGAFMLHIPYGGIAPAFTDRSAARRRRCSPASPPRCRTCARAGRGRSR